MSVLRLLRLLQERLYVGPPSPSRPSRPLTFVVGHGTQTSCAIPQSTALASKYLSGSAAEQAELELRYGAANIKRLVAAWEEDRVNREYLEANSMQCPGCLVQIEKSVGCSHMLCEGSFVAGREGEC